MFKYIGIPYNKLNCYELIKLVMLNEYNINIKDPPCPIKGDELLISNNIDRYFEDYVQSEPVQTPFDGCVVLMNSNKRLNHLGLFVEYQGKKGVLHASALARQTVYTPIKYLQNHGLTIDGYYTWL